MSRPGTHHPMCVYRSARCSPLRRLLSSAYGGCPLGHGRAAWATLLCTEYIIDPQCRVSLEKDCERALPASCLCGAPETIRRPWLLLATVSRALKDTAGPIAGTRVYYKSAVPNDVS
jgi:hypothetical protein